MTASPPSIEPLSAAIVSSTGFPDGTMSQTARAESRAPRARLATAVVRDDFVAAADEPLGHVGAHSPEADHAEFHGTLLPLRAHDIEHLLEASLRAAAEIDPENAPLF